MLQEMYYLSLVSDKVGPEQKKKKKRLGFVVVLLAFLQLSAAICLKHLGAKLKDF